MTEQLIVGTTRAGDEAIVSLEGELDLATIQTLRAALVAASSSSAANVVVDMARLSFMGAIGLGVLIAAHRRCAATGVRVTLRRPTGIVEKVFGHRGSDASPQRGALTEPCALPLPIRRRPCAPDPGRWVTHEGRAVGSRPKQQPRRGCRPIAISIGHSASRRGTRSGHCHTGKELRRESTPTGRTRGTGAADAEDG